MGTFAIKSTTNNSQYEYKDEHIIVQGGFTKNGVTGDLEQINGSCYHLTPQGEMGDFFGNFNGSVRGNNEIRYSTSEMSRQDANYMWGAIDAIEPHVIGDGE